MCEKCVNSKSVNRYLSRVKIAFDRQQIPTKRFNAFLSSTSYINRQKKSLLNISGVKTWCPIEIADVANTG